MHHHLLTAMPRHAELQPARNPTLCDNATTHGVPFNTSNHEDKVAVFDVESLVETLGNSRTLHYLHPPRNIYKVRGTHPAGMNSTSPAAICTTELNAVLDLNADAAGLNLLSAQGSEITDRYRAQSFDPHTCIVGVSRQGANTEAHHSPGE